MPKWIGPDAGGRGNDHAYGSIARRIGVRLRDVYARPEADPLPVNHVDLLLRLRQKERERVRAGG